MGCVVFLSVFLFVDPSDILMEVFGQYTEESILKDALEELKTSEDHIKLDPFHKEKTIQSSLNLENFNDLEEFLGICSNTNELAQDVDEKPNAEKSDDVCELDEVFESLVGSQDPLINLQNGNSDITGSSTDCTDTSFVFSDTTEVITSSDLLAQLMSQSGILTDQNAASSKTEHTSRKRRPSSDNLCVPEKLQKYSTETDADECCSIYSSCASSPEDRFAVRRQKNNEASKVSRANRKAKHQRLFEKEKELEKDNERLRKLIEDMSTETEILRKILVDKLSGVKSV